MTATQSTIFTMNFCAEIQEVTVWKPWNKLLTAQTWQDFKVHGLMPYSTSFCIDSIVIYEGSDEYLL